MSESCFSILLFFGLNNGNRTNKSAINAKIIRVITKSIDRAAGVSVSPMSSNRNERDNFECIMEIMNVPVLEGLREIFKQEWDKQWGIAKGMWDDTCISGNELFNMEKTNHAAKHYLQVFKSGKRCDWDSSALSCAILYSRALQPYIPVYVRNNVDVLRILRNDLTHIIAPQHKISDVAFANVYKKIKNTFSALSLPTADIERVRNSRKRRPSLRLSCLAVVLLTVFIAGLSYFWTRYNDIPDKVLFRILPIKPSHLIVNRSQTVHAILDELSNISISNNRALTYMYISGPQGSGRSQIARLVGQQYGENTSNDWFGGIVFVMTINGRSLLHLLNSYFDFAYRVNCDKTVIDTILYSENKAEEKVNTLLSEIVKKLKNIKTKYTCLMIVLNVLELSEISAFLPQLEDKSWQGCQVLITTQDVSSVPLNSSLTVHISVDQGMEPEESCKLLTDLSGLFDNQNLVSEVADKLDHQPLALVSAALYVKQLRESEVQITWKDYLKKHGEEKQNLAEMKQVESKEPKPSTAYAALSLAVKWIGENDSVMKHAFIFFSYVSHEPVPFHSVKAFVLHVDRSAFKTDQRIQQYPLVLSSDDGQIVSIFLHPIVHEVINHYISRYVKEDENYPRIVLQMLVLPRLSFLGQHYIPHLKSFYKRASSLPKNMLIPKLRDLRLNMSDRLFYFAHILELNDEKSLRQYYVDLCFLITSAID